MKKVTVTNIRTQEFIVQRASVQDCARFNRTPGIFEVLDEDGDRWCFAETENKAFDEIRKICSDDEALGNSTINLEVTA